MAHNTCNFILLLLLFSFASCKKADISFGNQLLDNAHTQIIRIDTISVELNAGYIDSFITSNKSIGLTGICKDPWLFL
ncbi:hypothetical protein BH10BAC2_BH10BAC2_11680 [soil metagenome]